MIDSGSRFDEAISWAMSNPDATTADVARMFAPTKPTGRPGRPRKFTYRTGRRVGAVMVIGHAGAMYDVECDCGRRYMASPSAVHAHAIGILRSCGGECGERKPRVAARRVLPPRSPRSNEQQAASHLRAIISGAKERGLLVTITIDDIIRVRIDKPCEYCGAKLGRSTCIDRIDNAVGYTPDNIAACCPHCNDAKGHLLTGDEFRAAMQVRLARTGVGAAWDGVVMRSRTSKRSRK